MQEGTQSVMDDAALKGFRAPPAPPGAPRPPGAPSGPAAPPALPRAPTPPAAPSGLAPLPGAPQISLGSSGPAAPPGAPRPPAAPSGPAAPTAPTKPPMTPSGPAAPLAAPPPPTAPSGLATPAGAPKPPVTQSGPSAPAAAPRVTVGSSGPTAPPEASRLPTAPPAGAKDDAAQKSIMGTSSSKPKASGYFVEKAVSNVAPKSEWLDMWKKLLAEAAAHQSEIAEDLQNCASSPEAGIDSGSQLQSCASDAEAGVESASQAPGLMHQSVWGALARLRREVKAYGKVGGTKDVAQHGMHKRLKELRVEQQSTVAVLDVAGEELERDLQVLMDRFDSWMTAPAFVSHLPSSNSTQSRQRWRGPCGSDGGAYETGRLWATHAISGASRSSQLSTAQGGLEPSTGADEDAVLQELREAVQNLDEEVRRDGGLTGGWLLAEHQMFVRHFKKFRHHSLSLLCECLSEELPTIPYADIEAHVDWFSQLEQKQALKRSLVAKWRDRTHQLDKQALEAHELMIEKQRRRREGLQRSRSEVLRAQVKDWQESQSQLQKWAAVERHKLECKKSESEKKRKRKEQQRKEAQQQGLDEFRRQREAIRKEEEKALTSRQSSAPPSPEVKQRISQRNKEMLKIRHEATRANPYLQRSSSQPAKRSTKSRYRDVENNPYAPTKCYREHVEAMLWGEPKTELAGECLRVVDPETSCIACLWEAGLLGVSSAAVRAYKQQHQPCDCPADCHQSGSEGAATLRVEAAPVKESLSSDAAAASKQQVKPCDVPAGHHQSGPECALTLRMEAGSSKESPGSDEAVE